MAPRSRKAQFTGASGATLSARLDMPPTPPVGYALFAHCFTCSKDTRAAAYLASALAERGIALLRFDFTGLGGSGGDFASTNFSSNVEDLVAAADFMRANFRAPEILVGHSLGGTAVLAAAPRIPEVIAVATIGSPFDPAHVLRQIPQRGEIERLGEAEVMLAGRQFRIRRQFLDDLAGQKLGEVVRDLGKALLIMHSPRDETVGIDNAAQLFQAARHPKSFVSLDPADHLLTRREDATYAGHLLAAWVARYLGDRAPAAPARAAGKVVVSETGEGRFTQFVTAGSHTVRADEPESAGGLDTGMSPYDFLIAALGTCTAMTLRMYADLKKIRLEQVIVELEHAKVHGADCADCESRGSRIDRIERLIRLEGELDDAQRARLLEIADKCPVHRTLQSEVSVVTRLQD